MLISELSDYWRGWVIGDFSPSILKTDLFEVGILKHQRNEDWPAHYHAEATEYNILVEGSMMIQEKIITAGTVFVLEKKEIANPIFLEDCTVVCIKVPSRPSDKINV